MKVGVDLGGTKICAVATAGDQLVGGAPNLKGRMDPFPRELDRADGA